MDIDAEKSLFSSNQHSRTQGYLTVLTTLDLLTKGLPNLDSVRQSHGRGVHQTSGRNQKSYNGKRGIKVTILGRTSDYRLVSHSNHRSRQLSDYLSWQSVDPGEWSLHPEVLQNLYHWWGMLNVDFLTPRFNNKLDRFIFRCRDGGTHSSELAQADVILQPHQTTDRHPVDSSILSGSQRLVYHSASYVGFIGMAIEALISETEASLNW